MFDGTHVSASNPLPLSLLNSYAYNLNNAYDNEYYNNNVMNFELNANDYVDSTTYDQRLMLNVDAQYNNGLASNNNIGQCC